MREAAVWTGAQAATKTRGRLADPCRIDLRARLVRSGGEVRVADMFYIRETESQCFELIMIEDKRRKGDLAPQHVTNAGLSLDRQPVGLQCRNIAVDCAHRCLHRLREIVSARQRFGL